MLNKGSISVLDAIHGGGSRRVLETRALFFQSKDRCKHSNFDHVSIKLCCNLETMHSERPWDGHTVFQNLAV